MIKLARFYEAAVLVAAGWASLATSAPATSWRTDGRWVLSNLFDGQTAVPRDIGIALSIGIQDFRPDTGNGDTSEARNRAQRALDELTLRDSARGTAVRLDFEISELTTIARPVEPLRENTRYELDASLVAGSALTSRTIPEPIEFTTRPGPVVTGVWLVEDTLMISFSEPIATGALRLSADSVDLLWTSDSGLQSATADRNLASFVWDNEGMLFRVAPVPEYGKLWIKVSRSVTGISGAPLDGNGDGTPGGLDDDFLQLVTVSDLPVCTTSEGRPEPCVPSP